MTLLSATSTAFTLDFSCNSFGYVYSNGLTYFKRETIFPTLNMVPFL